MSELLGPQKDDCACGCGKFGTVRKKVMRDGLAHVRGCECKRCLAPRYKQRASARERKIAKQIGGERHVMSGALSGVDISSQTVEIEETAEVAVVRGLKRWWLSKTVQTKLARLYSRQNLVPKAFVASWDGKPRLVVQEWDDWNRGREK